MLWIFSAPCKAVWLAWNALSSTGTHAGISSHSTTVGREGRSSSSSMPPAPPPPPPRCPPGWRGSPPGSERSASIRHCAAPPAAERQHRDDSPWPAMSARSAAPSRHKAALLPSSSGGREKSFSLCRVLGRSALFKHCRRTPLLTFLIFQTTPSSLSVTHPYAFHSTHMAKSNCLQDRGQCVQGNSAFTTLYWNHVPEVH